MSTTKVLPQASKRLGRACEGVAGVPDLSIFNLPLFARFAVRSRAWFLRAVPSYDGLSNSERHSTRRRARSRKIMLCPPIPWKDGSLRCWYPSSS